MAVKGAVDLARRWIPRSLRYRIQRHVSATRLKLRYREASTELAGVAECEEDPHGLGLRLGIVRNAAQYHCHFTAACLELGVPFRVLDLYCSDWHGVIDRSGCDGLLVWPDGMLSVWKELLEDRVAVAAELMKLPVMPGIDEIRLYENKRRMANWLRAYDLPHPRTWIFSDQAECERFLADCRLPVVFKANFGASGSGVQILRDRRRLRRLVRTAFGRGVLTDGADPRDRQWGVVLLQEFVDVGREWRLVRVGDSFFGHVKGARDGIHSGSGLVEWDVPEARHLELLERITERGGFRSMAVDAFEKRDGRLLVNELQAVFGASHSVDQMRVEGVPGRFVRRGDAWSFEPGDFARNACANERVRYFLASRFGKQLAPAGRGDDSVGEGRK